MKKVIGFDLEGPLSLQDNAYEVMRLIPEGDKIFEVISRYDDILTLEGREGYEPGDTLKLITPFLMLHKISEQDIKEVSNRTHLVKGAKELIKNLQENGWKVHIISTSYEQHAYNIAERLGISKRKVACTLFPLNRFYSFALRKKDYAIVENAENSINHILDLCSIDNRSKDREIKTVLDRFYWHTLRRNSLWRQICKEISVVGGRRKVQALEKMARCYNYEPHPNTCLNDIVAVGDSITDFQMLKVVEDTGGISIVFNGNIYVLPYGTVGLATTDMQDIQLILNVYIKEGRKGLKRVILQREAEQTRNSSSYYHWLVGKNSKEVDDILNIHKRFRQLVRGEAAKFG